MKNKKEKENLISVKEFTEDIATWIEDYELENLIIKNNKIKAFLKNDQKFKILVKKM